MSVLGFDVSTQSVKVVLLNSSLKVEYENSVVYVQDFPHYNTVDGVYKHDDGKTITQPVIMFVEAIEKLLNEMVSSGIKLSDIEAISASGQQHAPVFWSKDSTQKLNDLSSEKTLLEQLQGCFSVDNSPIWMDSSTTSFCRSFEKIVGGADKLASITGSSAFERFTAHQISKLFFNNPNLNKQTGRISLVSSFIATIFLGKHSQIDHSDGSGMNLLDLSTKQWSDICLHACSENTRPSENEDPRVTVNELKLLLGEPVPSHQSLGTIHSFFVQRFGFQKNCRIIASSGDNPCTLASMRLQSPNHACISLGTSDTIFGISSSLPTSDSRNSSEGHIFINPINPQNFMVMLCYKNGSITRQQIRDSLFSSSASKKDGWSEFNDSLLNHSTPGNNGFIGFFFNFPEITPHIPISITKRFNSENQEIDSFSSNHIEVRALIEGFALSALSHSKKLGMKPNVLYATGGASANNSILQVYANVFGVQVFRLESKSGGAALGAALRAMHGKVCAESNVLVDFDKFLESSTSSDELQHVCDPDLSTQQIYQDLLKRYEQLELKVISESHLTN